ncbi:imelysin family protein [Cocleimonas sp. KMM 6892]|uniref:imelysin family protein n=1 Tax=unclassified Cocleimonas TaxID=2639732 RepID=UPI002DD12BD4|nr:MULTISPECIES: imelysin family protein [unclassified Cocleimonas]MEB8432738.1 imelysin family protein [Cocleimonas sp. KMM 6892]MEC4744785.1 imelysin family protein [Cocleimonas sp. KMM 6896]
MKLNKLEPIKIIILSVLFTICCLLILSLFNNAWADESNANTPQHTANIEITEADRQMLLSSISKNAMLPIFKELKLASNTLYQQTQHFCGAKTEDSLSKLRQSWNTTANAWQQVDSLAFGPTTDENIDFGVYFLPIKKGIIKELLQRDTLSKKDIDAAGVGAQGLGALEYILFSREQSTAQILKSFTDQPQRCEYLQLSTELLNDNINTISNQWEHYGVQFGLAGNNSLYFLESSEAMTILVNKLYQSAQKVSNKKLGLLDSKNEIKNSTPYKLHAWRSGDSLDQVKANIIGIKQILKDGEVLQWLNQQNKQQLATDLEQLMDSIVQQKLKEKDLFDAIKTSPESLQPLVLNSKKLTELIKAQLAPSLGVELGFNDNDGD